MSTRVDRLDELLTRPSFYSDPYPAYRRLRVEDPVHWCEPWQQWIVTRHADVTEVLMSPERFSSSGWDARYIAKLPADVRARLPHLEQHYATPVLENTDPPAHRRLRTMVIKSFTANVLRAMVPQITQLVTTMIDEIAGRRRIDLVDDFAYPLPAAVIAQLFGAPVRETRRYASWSGDIIDFSGTGRPQVDRAERANDSLAAFALHLEGLIAEARATPREDLLSHLAREHEGERLTDRELIATCVVILLAGHETTANLIASGLLSLLRDPEQLATVRDDPDLMPGAIEEFLRFEGPVQRVRRVAREDTQLGDRSIAEGDLVMAFLGSANRDPEVYENPDRLDVRRDPKHLTFGHGVHFCVGAGLTRIEAPIAINELIARFPRLRLAVDTVEWKPNIVFRGLTALPLELT
jgi:cytochrome P450